jgi:hypothetical protein
VVGIHQIYSEYIFRATTTEQAGSTPAASSRRDPPQELRRGTSRSDRCVLGGLQSSYCTSGFDTVGAQKRHDAIINLYEIPGWLRNVARWFLLDKIQHGETSPATVRYSSPRSLGSEISCANEPNREKIGGSRRREQARTPSPLLSSTVFRLCSCWRGAIAPRVPVSESAAPQRRRRLGAHAAKPRSADTRAPPSPRADASVGYR